MWCDRGVNHVKLRLNRISCSSQFTIRNTACKILNLWCNNTDTISFQPNQPHHTLEFLYPLVSSTSFWVSSSISPILVHNWTTIAEDTVKLSLSSSPTHDHESTKNIVYTEYYIHWELHTPSTAYTEYCMDWVLHTPSTAYTEYCIHWVLHTPSTAYTK